MNWTKKHDELLLKFNLRPSTEFLWRWINRKIKSCETVELEINLKDFNKWVRKHRARGEYDPKTLKESIQELFNKTDGLFVELKKVTWYYFKIIVRPISFLDKEKFQKSGLSTDTTTPESTFQGVSQEERLKQQQQFFHSLSKLFKPLDINFTNDALVKIYRLSQKSIKEVKSAVELMLYRNVTSKIKNPEGFLIECLKHGWQQGFNPYYERDLPIFNTANELVNFLQQIEV